MSTETGKRKSAEDKPEDESSETKRPRCQDPDVTVVVGSGEEAQEFPCYRLVLSFASDVFDAMLSSNMSETDTGKILLPDKNPEEWKLFYTFIDPSTVRSAEVTRENVECLVPWFHQFQMNSLLTECDKVVVLLAADAKCIVPVKVRLGKLFPLLSLASTFSLEASVAAICKLAGSIFAEHGDDVLDDISILKKMIPFCRLRDTKGLFWKILRRYVPADLDCSDLDSLFDNEMLPYLLQTGKKLQMEEDDSGLVRIPESWRSYA